MSARRELILVVDDEPRMTRFIRMNLELEGYQVIEVHDGLEALDKARVNLPDLIILDIPYQESDRWETLLHIRERLPDIPVIALTTPDDVGSTVDCLRHGADYSMTKPVRERALQARIRALLRRSRQVAPLTLATMS